MAGKDSRHADPIVHRLRAIGQESPDLKEATELYGAILPLLRDAELDAGQVSLTHEQAREKMGKGLPLLYDIDVSLDCTAAGGLMLKLAAALEKVSGKRRQALRRIRLWLEENAVEAAGLLPHVAASDRCRVMDVARDLQLDPDLFWGLAQNSLKPALQAWRLQVAPIAEGIPWNRAACFVCGSDATLGELRDNNLTRYLRCGQCGADWKVQRLRCPYCGNENHQTLKVLYAGGHWEGRRIEACDNCRGYLKVITSFGPTPPEMLPVEDLATVHLDYVAQQHGYIRRGNRYSAQRSEII